MVEQNTSSNDEILNKSKKTEELSLKEQNTKLNVSEKFSYGLGDAATAFAGVTVTSFAMFYFTDVVGVPAALLGTILMLSRVFDAITNVAMGYIIDLTDTKYGKTRPWIIGAILPLAISLILVFSVPEGWSQTNQIWYIFFAYNFYFLMYTISNVPYGTLGTLLTRDQKERSNLNLFRMFGYFAMMLVVSNVTVPLVNWLGGDSTAWQVVTVIFGIIMAIMFVLTVAGTKERVKATSHDSSEKIPLKDSIRYVLTNKYWIMMFLIMVMGWTLLDLMQGINIYYAEHILNNPNLVGPLSIFLTIPLLIGFVLVGVSNKYIGRKRTIYLGMLSVILGSALILFNTTYTPLIYFGQSLRGLGFASVMGNAYAMLADTIEYGEWKSGKRVEGLTYSGGTFATTLGHGFGSSGIGWILGLGGYVSGVSPADQPESVSTVIHLLFIMLPIILALGIIIFLVFYNLDDIYPDIMKDLSKRENN